MYYNESIGPRYSRNPLSANHTNIDSFATSKKNSVPLNQSGHCSKQSFVHPNNSKDSFEEINQSTLNKDKSNQRAIKRLGKGKENCQLFKEEKILKLRKEINQSENDNASTPKISRGSKQINASRASTFKNTNLFLEKNYGQKSFAEYTPQQSMFSPKILEKSKSLVRKFDVSTLLYEDARRRQQKEQYLQQSQRKQFMSPKINSNTNALVLKKIHSQFIQLVSEDELNPLIALSVLEQIFNVNLNPNKQSPHYLQVQKLLTILAGNRGDGEVRSDRLWQLITVVIMGQTEKSVFSSQESKEIVQNYQYFYKARMTRQRKTASPERPTFRPKTNDSSSKLANSFREKTCQKVDSFIENQKVSINIKNGIYTIEDIFIIDHHKKLAENERKRIELQNKEFQLCTFKPDLSHSSSTLNAIRQKPKIALRATKAQTLKTEYTQNFQHRHEKSRMSFSKIQPIKSREHRELMRKERQEKVAPLADNIKDVEKIVFRLSVGRQKRQFSNKVMERGYPKDENWTEYQRIMHRQSIQNNKKLKGFTSN